MSTLTHGGQGLMVTGPLTGVPGQPVAINRPVALLNRPDTPSRSGSPAMVLANRSDSPASQGRVLVSRSASPNQGFRWVL